MKILSVLVIFLIVSLSPSSAFLISDNINFDSNNLNSLEGSSLTKEINTLKQENINSKQIVLKTVVHSRLIEFSSTKKNITSIGAPDTENPNKLDHSISIKKNTTSDTLPVTENSNKSNDSSCYDNTSMVSDSLAYELKKLNQPNLNAENDSSSIYSLSQELNSKEAEEPLTNKTITEPSSKPNEVKVPPMTHKDINEIRKGDIVQIKTNVSGIKGTVKRYATITDINPGNSVTYKYHGTKANTKSWDDFWEMFTGMVIVPEKGDNQEEILEIIDCPVEDEPGDGILPDNSFWKKTRDIHFIVSFISLLVNIGLGIYSMYLNCNVRNLEREIIAQRSILENINPNQTMPLLNQNELRNMI